MNDGINENIGEVEEEISKLKDQITTLEIRLGDTEISKEEYDQEKAEIQKIIRTKVEHLHSLKQEKTGNKLPQLPSLSGKKKPSYDTDLNAVILDTEPKEKMEMQLIDSLQVPGFVPKSIQLLYGDLTDIPPEHAVDIVIVSAYMNDYYPVPGTLIHALYKKGVNIQQLSADMKFDYRKELSCWLSQEITDKQDGINFNNLLVFEGFTSGLPSETVGDIFRAMFPFLTNDTNKVATSLVSTGGAGMDREVMMEKLVEGAYYWMKHGLPLNELKIVIYNKSTLELVSPLFSSMKHKFADNDIENQKNTDTQLHNIFISYSHKNTREAEHVFQSLKELNENLSIFMDKLELQPGQSWQQEIFSALEKSQLILTLLSPNYLESKVCIEEFDIAMMKNREAEKQILFPLLVSDTNLPYYMRMIQYLDLQGLDMDKIKHTLKQIIDKIETSEPKSSLTQTNPYDTPITTQTQKTEKQTVNYTLDSKTLLESIQGLQKVYGNKIPLSRIAERNNINFNQLLTIVEDLIIEGKLDAQIDSMETSASEDDFLIVRSSA